MIALVVLMVYWVILFGEHLTREAMYISGAVEPPPIVYVDAPELEETVKTFTTGDGFELWCALRSVPKIIRRPSVSKQRIAATIDERHVYVGGLDVTLGEDMGGCINVIKAIKGKPSDVRKFIAERYSQDIQEIVFQKWGL